MLGLFNRLQQQEEPADAPNGGRSDDAAPGTVSGQLTDGALHAHGVASSPSTQPMAPSTTVAADSPAPASNLGSILGQLRSVLIAPSSMPQVVLPSSNPLSTSPSPRTGHWQSAFQEHRPSAAANSVPATAPVVPAVHEQPHMPRMHASTSASQSWRPPTAATAHSRPAPLQPLQLRGVLTSTSATPGAARRHASTSSAEPPPVATSAAAAAYQPAALAGNVRGRRYMPPPPRPPSSIPAMHSSRSHDAVPTTAPPHTSHEARGAVSRAAAAASTPMLIAPSLPSLSLPPLDLPAPAHTPSISHVAAPAAADAAGTGQRPHLLLHRVTDLHLDSHGNVHALHSPQPHTAAAGMLDDLVLLPQLGLTQQPSLPSQATSQPLQPSQHEHLPHNQPQQPGMRVAGRDVGNLLLQEELSLSPLAALPPSPPHRPHAFTSSFEFSQPLGQPPPQQPVPVSHPVAAPQAGGSTWTMFMSSAQPSSSPLPYPSFQSFAAGGGARVMQQQHQQQQPAWGVQGVGVPHGGAWVGGLREVLGAVELDPAGHRCAVGLW